MMEQLKPVWSLQDFEHDGEYYLEMDTPMLREERVTSDLEDEDNLLHLNVLPEHYLGNFATAKVIILGGNPKYTEGNGRFFAQQKARYDAGEKNSYYELLLKSLLQNEPAPSGDYLNIAQPDSGTDTLWNAEEWEVFARELKRSLFKGDREALKNYLVRSFAYLSSFPYASQKEPQLYASYEKRAVKEEIGAKSRSYQLLIWAAQIQEPARQHFLEKLIMEENVLPSAAYTFLCLDELLAGYQDGASQEAPLVVIQQKEHCWPRYVPRLEKYRKLYKFTNQQRTSRFMPANLRKWDGNDWLETPAEEVFTLLAQDIQQTTANLH